MENQPLAIVESSNQTSVGFPIVEVETYRGEFAYEKVETQHGGFPP